MSKVSWTHSNPNVGVGVQAMNDSLVMPLHFTIPSFVTVNMGTATLYDTITIWK